MEVFRKSSLWAADVPRLSQKRVPAGLAVDLVDGVACRSPRNRPTYNGFDGLSVHTFGKPNARTDRTG